MKNLQIHLEFSIKKNYLSFWRYIVSEKTKADCGGGVGWRGVGWLHFFSILTTASRYQLHRLLGSHFPLKLFLLAFLYPSAVLNTLQDFRL